jgi:hypothetical protein
VLVLMSLILGNQLVWARAVVSADIMAEDGSGSGIALAESDSV